MIKKIIFSSALVLFQKISSKMNKHIYCILVMQSSSSHSQIISYMTYYPRAFICLLFLHHVSGIETMTMGATWTHLKMISGTGAWFSSGQDLLVGWLSKLESNRYFFFNKSVYLFALAFKNCFEQFILPLFMGSFGPNSSSLYLLPCT